MSIHHNTKTKGPLFKIGHNKAIITLPAYLTRVEI